MNEDDLAFIKGISAAHKWYRENPTPEDLRRAIRATMIYIFECCDAPIDPVIVEPLRKRFKIEPRMHEGLSEKAFEDDRKRFEWFAGQILDVVDQKAWHVVNSLNNTLDRFVPGVREPNK